ncbi:MAG: hypothetical protein QG567_1085 [Campylobacterota bacterium]|nr:hypothetical protein [Campylobacterota bacterium]
MYTDETSCITAGYYWNATYCSYKAAESHISIEFGSNASEVDYTNALALDPSVLYGKSLYSLGFKDYILKSERMDISSSNWMIYGLDTALVYTKKTEELNTTTINNIMTSSKFDIKYLGSKDADSFNTTEFDIFTSNAKAYEFITTRKADEYSFHDLQIDYDTQMSYGSFDEFITDRNGTAYFMNKKDSYDTGIAFNTADYSTGDRSGVIAEVTGAQVVNSNIGSWSISFIEEIGSDVLFIYPNEEYKPYYYRAIFTINNDGDLQRGEYQAIGDVYKFVLFDAAGHNEFSDFIELNYNIAVPLDVQDVVIEPEEPVVTINSLIISPVDINVSVSTSLQFSVSAKYSDNNISDVTDKVVWSALKGTISSSGLYTATDSEEIDTITATFEGFSVSTTVRILPAAIEPEPEPEATFTAEVVSGWNLMSLPTRAYMNLNDLIETFGVNAGKIDYLAKYDSIGWSYFLVDVHSETVDRFTSLSSNEGFWLKASSGFELKYTMPEDISSADEVLPLSAGWNLAGFNSDKTPQEIKNLYAGYGIESIWIYKNGKWSVYIPDIAKNALVSTTIPRITTISKFDGVWINVK